MPPKKQTQGLARALSFSPETLKEETRTVDIIISTATEVAELDYKSWEVLPTIIHQAGIEYPKQVPMLDTHSRSSVADVLGSIRDIRVEGGMLVGTAFYGRSQIAVDAFNNVRDGHLTDYSLGATIRQVAYLSKGESLVLDGVTYTATEETKIITKCKLREVSNCPIGADTEAKVREAATEGNYELPPELEILHNHKEDNMPSETAPETAPSVDRASIEAEVIRAEQARSAEVIAICNRFDLPIAEHATRTVSEMNTIALDRAAALLAPTKTTSSPATIRGECSEPGDHFRANVEEAILLRSGNGDWSKASGVVKELAQRSLKDLARESLRINGQLNSNENEMQMIGRALSTSDFPLLLANVANKSVKAGYETQPETWRTFASTGSVRDFKTNTKVRATSLTGSIQEIPEGGEYKALARGEEQEQYGIKTYGGLLVITRQLIINDDLGQLTDDMMQLGEETALTVGDIVWNAFLSNPNMGDGNPLFGAGHGNIATTPSTISEAAMQEMWLAMRSQKENNRRLAINPEYLLLPDSLFGVTEEYFKSVQYSDGNVASTRKAAFASKFASLQRIYDQRLDEANALLGTSSWYAFGAKNKTVKAFFLNGIETPYMERQTSFNNDGTSFKIRIDVGAKAMDYRTVYRNIGV